eukprot:9474949-Pyramimonas_sp.AAC.1
MPIFVHRFALCTLPAALKRAVLAERLLGADGRAVEVRPAVPPPPPHAGGREEAVHGLRGEGDGGHGRPAGEAAQVDADAVGGLAHAQPAGGNGVRTNSVRGRGIYLWYGPTV